MRVHSLPYAADVQPLFVRIADLPGAVLLHSGDRRHYQSRYDIISAEPDQVVRYQAGQLQFGTARLTTAHPLTALSKALGTQPELPPTPRRIPFTAGFIGLFGYPLHQQLERQQPSPADPTRLPPLLGGYYSWSVVTDHYQRTTTLYSHRNARATEAIETRLRGVSASSNAVFAGAAKPFQPSSSDAHYRQAFDTIQNYIQAGDCYQVNLARHYQARVNPAAGWSLYTQLQAVQGGAFSAYLSHPDGQVLCLSPERLALLSRLGDRRVIETCPIKGTAPRHADTKTDRQAATVLRESEKDRAENLMIVDLLRNDLGRIAKLGSVRVQTLFELVSLPNVHHLVSTISADLDPRVTTADVLRALLPGGSITGAPKIRAVDIINEVEAVGRSAYCGSLGYIDHSGRMDMNIAIRTLVLEPSGDLHLWGGGAIVADSNADSEAQEINHKIGRLMQALRQ